MSHSTTGIIANLLVQATATPIIKYAFFNEVGTCTAANSAIVLPASPVLGQQYCVKNSGIHNCLIFPAVGDAIDARAANTCLHLAPQASICLMPVSASQWHSYAHNGPASVVAGGASATLSASDSGLIYSVTTALGADQTIVLPAATIPSLEFTFISSTDGFATHDIKIDCGAGLAEGVATVNGALVACNGARYAIFEQGPVEIGDRIRCVSNGTNWVIDALGRDALSITFA